METKTRPIIFSDDMVRAILDGRKTQTRRVVDCQPQNWFGWYPNWLTKNAVYYKNENHWRRRAVLDQCKYGGVGDYLFVKESFVDREWYDETNNIERTEICYGATPRIGIRTPGIIRDVDLMQYLHESSDLSRHCFGSSINWAKADFMEEQQSRIWIKIKKIWVERLCKITEEDAVKEGIELVEFNCYRNYMEGNAEGERPGCGYLEDPVGSCRSLFKSIYGADIWDKNPWVWVIEFEVDKERSHIFDLGVK